MQKYKRMTKVDPPQKIGIISRYLLADRHGALNLGTGIKLTWII